MRSASVALVATLVMTMVCLVSANADTAADNAPSGNNSAAATNGAPDCPLLVDTRDCTPPSCAPWVEPANCAVANRSCTTCIERVPRICVLGKCSGGQCIFVNDPACESSKAAARETCEMSKEMAAAACAANSAAYRAACEAAKTSQNAAYAAQQAACKAR